MGPESITERMAAAARELQDQHDAASTVKSAVELLVRNVKGCESASIALVRGRRRLHSPVASDDLAATADWLQHELGEGPCLSALWEHEEVYVPDLATDSRWATWARRVTEATEARSVLSFRLFTNQDLLGALNMYSTGTDAFNADDRTEGQALASHIAIAVVAAQRLEQFEAALDSRTVIAQACGLMMERFSIDAVQAFALLTRFSSAQNVKLRDVAAELIRSRALPDVP